MPYHRAIVAAALTVAIVSMAPVQAQPPSRPKAPEPQVSTLAGDGKAGLQDGPARSARFLMPASVAYDRQGRLYMADSAAQRIRLLDKGVVSTVAGSGALDASGQYVERGYRDGPAATAQFAQPSGVAVGPDDAIYVADELNHCIRKILNGSVSTFAGRVDSEGANDGPVSAASFKFPKALAFDARGNLYVADYSVGIRKITPDGTVTTLKMTVGRKTYTGVTVVGSGTEETVYAVDDTFVHVFHTATQADEVWANKTEGDRTFPHFYGIAGVNSTNVLMTDPRSHVLRLWRNAEQPFVSTFSALAVAGSPTEDESVAAGFRDGPVLEARFNTPLAVAIFHDHVAVADTGNRMIRGLPLPDVRGPVGNDTGQFTPDKTRYRIAFVSSSWAFWVATWPTSIGGQIESALNDPSVQVRPQRPAKVSICRMDATNLWTEAQYIGNYMSDGQVNLVILSLTRGHFDSFPAQYNNLGPLAAGTIVLAELQKQLAKSHTKLWVFVHPEGAEVSPIEEVIGREKDSGNPRAATYSAATGAREAAEAVRKSGVPYYSSVDEFLSYERGPRPTLLFGPDDTHFVPAGNAFVARIIVRELRKVHPW